MPLKPTNNDMPVHRQPAPQQRDRHIGDYINRQQQAPQPPQPKSIARQIDREANKRKNGSI